MNLSNARDEAFKLANSKYQIGDTNFSKYSSIYLASTSNVRKTMEQYKNKEVILAMGGQVLMDLKQF